MIYDPFDCAQDRFSICDLRFSFCHKDTETLRIFDSRFTICSSVISVCSFDRAQDGVCGYE